MDVDAVVLPSHLRFAASHAVLESGRHLLFGKEAEIKPAQNRWLPSGRIRTTRRLFHGRWPGSGLFGARRRAMIVLPCQQSFQPSRLFLGSQTTPLLFLGTSFLFLVPVDAEIFLVGIERKTVRNLQIALILRNASP